MTDSQQKPEEINVLNGDNGIEDAVRTQTRRSALGLSFAGGLAAMLAACGKYVTKFDKRGLDTVVKGDGDAGGVKGGGGGTTGPGNIPPVEATPTPTPTPTSTPPPEAEPPSKFCFDTSKATKVPEADFFVTDAKALYGNKFSSLLAVKVQKGKAATPVVGDLVHILLKKSATESYLAASRRVRSTDEYIDGIGLVFDTLNLNSYVGIQVLVTKGDKQHISELPITYVSAHNGKPVYDMSLARTDRVKSDDLFALGFGDSGAPIMEGTSSTSGATLGVLSHGGNYTAASAGSTWNLSKLIPSGTELKNIFGQSMTSSGGMLHDHQSLVVYRPRSETVNGKAFDGYIRYFIYVG